jgi:hypothetical protein
MEPRLRRPATRPVADATQPSTDVLGSLNWLKPQPLRLTPYAQEPDAPAPAVRASVPPPAVATGDANFPTNLSPEDDPRAVAASARISPAVSAEQLEHKLAQHVRDYPKDLEGQMDYEMMLFIEGQPVPQMSAMSGLRGEDRDILSALMDGLSNFRSVVRSDNNLLLASKTRPLLDMADRLRAQSELILPTISLCSRVESFGVYTPIESSRFTAGRDNEVIVYCEVQNFQSRMSTENQWQTQLTQEMVLYTESGLPVWPAKSNAQPVTDLCHQLRHDFFIAKRVTLPRNLTIGRYVLKITVTDQEANRVAEATTPVEIVAE